MTAHTTPTRHAAMPMAFSMRLDSRTITRALSAVIVLLLCLHIGLQLDRYETHIVPWQIQAMFDVDQEMSVPTWYSSMALGFAALLLFVIASAHGRAGTRDARGWRAMTAVVLLLSMDEIAGLHETVNSLSPVMWTIPFGLLALAVALAFLPFVLRQQRDTRLGIVLAGIVYVAGAGGVEFITSQFYGESNKRQLFYALITPFEEGLEMFGIVLLIRTLLRLMERDAGSATIPIDPARAPV